MKCSRIAPMYDQRLVQPEVPHATLNDRLESFSDAHFGSDRHRLCLGSLSSFVRTDRKCRLKSAQQRPIGTWLQFCANEFDHKANYLKEQVARSYHNADGCSALLELITAVEPAEVRGTARSNPRPLERS
jgi:hypothetical protein